jgi:hypothetical protein
MFTSGGLADWELVFVSGTIALGMLVISAIIGALVAYLALREPAPFTVKARKSAMAPSLLLPQPHPMTPVATG